MLRWLRVSGVCAVIDHGRAVYVPVAPGEPPEMWTLIDHGDRSVLRDKDGWERAGFRELDGGEWEWAVLLGPWGTRRHQSGRTTSESLCINAILGVLRREAYR